jgi:hypothetical protein
VHDARSVRRLEGRDDGRNQLNRLELLEAPLAVEQVDQGLALQVREHHEGQAVVGVARVQELHDVRVGAHGHGLRFA